MLPGLGEGREERGAPRPCTWLLQGFMARIGCRDKKMAGVIGVDIDRPNAGQGDRGMGWTTLKWLI